MASTGAWAVAGGVWALVPVGRARGVTRTLLVAVPAAAAAAAVAASGWRAKAGPGGGTSLRAAVLLPVAAGGVMAFTHWASLVLDHGVEDFLARRGVRRPRLVMAAVAAVATALLDRRAVALRDGREPLGDARTPARRPA
ncbi:hypothetical protein [Aquipuribacter hungaricus]|uniref:Uncharacterized protein n=1 Tax=Aquipuribacter hungaricus TaxID=545624 RepID=A0ABV7WC13_9MICO